LAGILAGSGYGLAAWMMGVRVRKGLLCTVALLQFAAYGAAQYVEYQLRFVVAAPNAPIGFWEYFDAATRGLAWNDKNGKPGQPLHELGYLVRLGEIIGFVGGGLAMPALLQLKPYCEACQVYQRSKRLGVFAASALPRKIKKKDRLAQATFDGENRAAYDRGVELALQVLTHAANDQADLVNTLLVEHAETVWATRDYPIRVVIEFEKCPRCLSGQVIAKQRVGAGRQLKITELLRVPTTATFARNLEAIGW
jgi:hypothetical protein